MCFAPYISLSTFIIEFLLSIYFLTKNPKDKLNRIIALISLGLGIYQLNEFLICTTGLRIFTIFAMSTTAILPALGINYAFIIRRQKLKWWNLLLYSPAIYFIITFLFIYKTPSICDTVFIIHPAIGIYGLFFAIYYGIYIFLALTLFSFQKKIKNHLERRMYSLGILSYLIFTIPAVIFIILLPSFIIKFPSVYCEFALLLALTFIYIMYYKNKHKINYE